MLKDHPVYATIPTTDVERLTAFYADTLGFEAIEETRAGVFFGAANGTLFAVTRQSGGASGTHTQMGFRVQNIEQEVAELRSARLPGSRTPTATSSGWRSSAERAKSRSHDAAPAWALGVLVTAERAGTEQVVGISPNDRLLSLATPPMLVGAARP